MAIIQGDLSRKNSFNIAIVTSLFNEEITLKLEKGAIDCLESRGMSPYAVVHVPGAVEIPIAIKNLLMKAECDAVIALGLVIRGDTNHYDYVCNSVERGCSQLQLEYNKPIAFGVLTTENMGQAEDRTGGAKGHKGYEAAEVAISMLQVLESIRKI